MKLLKKNLLIIFAIALALQPLYVGANETEKSRYVNWQDVKEWKHYDCVFINKEYSDGVRKFEDIDTNSFIVDENNPKYKSVDGCVVSKDGKELCLVPKGKLESKECEIPNGIEKISKEFFENKNVKKIILPASVKKIEKKAFMGCQSLMEIDMNGVETIDELSFAFCGNLKKVQMKKVKKIGKEAFTYCENLKKVKLQKQIKVGKSAFSQFTTIEYGIKFKKITPYLFYFAEWNDVSGADGYQYKITLYSKRNKKIKKTVTAFTTKGYIKSYGKTERTLGKYAKQHKKEYKYFRTKMKIRAYKKQGKKKIYTKWSKEIKQM